MAFGLDFGFSPVGLVGGLLFHAESLLVRDSLLPASGEIARMDALHSQFYFDARSPR